MDPMGTCLGKCNNYSIKWPSFSPTCGPKLSKPVPSVVSGWFRRTATDCRRFRETTIYSRQTTKITSNHPNIVCCVSNKLSTKQTNWEMNLQNLHLQKHNFKKISLTFFSMRVLLHFQKIHPKKILPKKCHNSRASQLISVALVAFTSLSCLWP